jgi:putative membrane protein
MAMPVVMLLALILCLYLIFSRRGARPLEGPQSVRNLDTALDILKKRYARGEITKQEYEDIKKDII